MCYGGESIGYTKPSYVTVPFGHLVITPYVASSSYYFGKVNTIPIATAVRNNVYVPCKGVIRAVVMMNASVTAVGTNEDWTMSIRVNNTTTYAIATTGAATNVRTWNNFNLNIPVNAGDFFEILTDTPAWVTAPSGTACQGVVLIESA